MFSPDGGCELPPSDSGIDGAIPLPPDSWAPMRDSAISDTEWSQQNARINELLMGRARQE